jgi:hypothetical protein
LLVRPGWGEIELTPGVFNWTNLDSNLAMAASLGKRAIIAVLDGPHAPTWLYSLAAARSFMYQEKVIDSTGKTTYTTSLMPIPWDQMYQTRKLMFLTALAAKYDLDPRVALVHCTAASYNGLEFSLPETNPQDGTSYRNAWNTAGYTTATLMSAWNQIIIDHVSLFKTKLLDCDLHPVFNDYTIAQSNIDIGQQAIGQYRFGSYGGWLSGRTDLYPPLLSLAATCGQSNSYSNWQLIGNVTNQPTRFNPQGTLEGAFNQALTTTNSRMVEVWLADTKNPALTTELTKWNDLFRNTP